MGEIDNVTEAAFTLNSASETDVEMNVPLVEATLYAGHLNDTATIPPPPPARVRVRVVAPSALPPGYVLLILYQEKDESGNAKDIWKKGIVQIPSDGYGVEKGQVFEAETRTFDTVQQIRGHFWQADGANFCCSPITDQDFCLLSWFCAPVAWACLYEQLLDLERQNIGEKSFRPQFVAKRIGAISLLFLVLSLAYFSKAKGGKEDSGDGSGLAKKFGLVFLVSGMFVRSKVREYYGIKGDFIRDGLCVGFLSPCAAMQSHSHMKKAHEHPHLGYISRGPLPAEAEKLV